MEFIVVLIIFAVVYFGICLPAFQWFSQRSRGRRFVVRLGTPWSAANAEHRWDVLLSFVSFAVALAIAMFIWDWLMRLGYLTAPANG